MNDIRLELPHGAIKEIAKRVQLSTSTVSRVLNGIIDSPRKGDILKATADYLKDYKRKNKEAAEAINEALYM